MPMTKTFLIAASAIPVATEWNRRRGAYHSIWRSLPTGLGGWAADIIAGRTRHSVIEYAREARSGNPGYLTGSTVNMFGSAMTAV